MSYMWIGHWGAGLGCYGIMLSCYLRMHVGGMLYFTHWNRYWLNRSLIVLVNLLRVVWVGCCISLELWLTLSFCKLMELWLKCVYGPLACSYESYRLVVVVGCTNYEYSSLSFMLYIWLWIIFVWSYYCYVDSIIMPC